MIGRGLRLLVPACVAFVCVDAGASAAVGDLTYLGCQTAELETGPVPAGSGACALFTGEEFGGASAGGADAGFENLEAIAVSPDGISAYVAGGDDDALVRLNRDPAIGALAFQFCFSGDTATECADIPFAQAGGVNSGLDDPESVTVSPDGISVYLTTRADDSIFRFNRNPNTGFVGPQDCITGEIESGPMPAGTGACTLAAGATLGGVNSGFDDLKTKTVAIPPDGRSLYAASELDDSVLRFDRSPATGALTYAGCITGESASAPPCAPLPSATPSGIDSGIDQPRWLDAGDEGRSLYVASERDDSVARFDRDPATGALTYAGCLTGETETGPAPGGSGACAPIGTAAASGSNSGLDEPRALDLSPDGSSLYVAAAGDDAVAHFTRDPATGTLAYAGCSSTETESGPAPGSGACAAAGASAAGGAQTGLDQLRGIAVSSDGSTVHTIAQGEDAVAGFDRNQITGGLAFIGCTTGDSNLGACATIASATAAGDSSGLSQAESFALSPDARSLYVAAERDHGIAAFARELDTDPPETEITKGPKRRSEKRRAKLEFSSDEADAAFECKLDKRSFKPCESPLKTKRLKRRKHKIRVQAIDPAGNVDASPAKRKWRVLKKD